MADASDLQVTSSIEDFPIAVTECSWYFGAADAALGMRGIDYGSMHSGMSQVEDDAKHAERIRAPFALDHREGLWNRSWVELVMSALSHEHASLLRVAFTAVGWPWDAESVGGKYAPRARWESELREALYIVRYSHKGGDQSRFPTHAVCLLELALSAGIVQKVAELHPAWAAAREALGDRYAPSRTHMLQFLKGIAEDAFERTKVDGRVGAARDSIESIRTRSISLLAPALQAYSESRREADQSMRPANVKARKFDPRTEAFRERQAKKQWRVSDRIAAIQESRR